MSDETTTTAPAPKAKAAPKPLVPCWCGCGGETRGRFVPGHDARFHGQAKKVARGLLEPGFGSTSFPHEEARAEFARHVALEAPKAAAWLAAGAEKAAKREAKAAPAETPPVEPEIAA